MISCVLFDCDGTLVDSEHLANIALANNLKAYALELDPEQLMQRYRGWKLASLLDEIEQTYSITLKDDFEFNYRRDLNALFNTDLKPIAGVQAALDTLIQPMAVVSSGPANKIALALKVCGLSDYFGTNIYSSYDIGIWKPDPGIYRFAAQSMGFKASECVVVEDSITGLEASVKAGMHTLFYNPHKLDYDSSSVTCFDDMHALPKLIKAINSGL